MTERKRTAAVELGEAQCAQGTRAQLDSSVSMASSWRDSKWAVCVIIACIVFVGCDCSSPSDDELRSIFEANRARFEEIATLVEAEPLLRSDDRNVLIGWTEIASLMSEDRAVRYRIAFASLRGVKTVQVNLQESDMAESLGARRQGLTIRFECASRHFSEYHCSRGIVHLPALRWRTIVDSTSKGIDGEGLVPLGEDWYIYQMRG